MTPDLFAATSIPAVLQPRVSIIMPSYNSGPYLRQALSSALEQVPPPFEVVVQDGGSTDETLDILRSLDERVSWVSAPDRGQSEALNLALARATGDIVLWLNADDVIVPGALAVATAAFASDPDLAFAYGDFDMIDSTGAAMRRYRSSEYSWKRVYVRGCYIFSGSLFVRRRALVAIGAFDATLKVCMDFDLLLRLGAAGPSRHLRQTIGQLRMHESNKSSKMLTSFLREGFRVRRRYAGRSPGLWMSAAHAAALSAFMLATTPARLSSRWPRHGRSKTL